MSQFETTLAGRVSGHRVLEYDARVVRHGASDPTFLHPGPARAVRLCSICSTPSYKRRPAGYTCVNRPGGLSAAVGPAIPALAWEATSLWGMPPSPGRLRRQAAAPSGIGRGRPAASWFGPPTGQRPPCLARCVHAAAHDSLPHTGAVGHAGMRHGRARVASVLGGYLILPAAARARHFLFSAAASASASCDRGLSGQLRQFRMLAAPPAVPVTGPPVCVRRHGAADALPACDPASCRSGPLLHRTRPPPARHPPRNAQAPRCLPAAASLAPSGMRASLRSWSDHASYTS